MQLPPPPCTLADGANGQIKTIINVSTSGTNAVTITPTNLRGYKHNLKCRR